MSDSNFRPSFETWLKYKTRIRLNKICENDSFTAASRFNEYSDEKITQILSSLDFAP